MKTEVFAVSLSDAFDTIETFLGIGRKAGISVGGKTGLTSVVVVILFLLFVFISPIVGIVPVAATAPVFFTIIFMDFTGSITNGIAIGFICYCICIIVKGKAKKIHPIMYIVTALFIINRVI